MVRKISVYIVAFIFLFGAFAPIGKCATYSVYDNGSISSTYTTYFKDIMAGQSILDDYVAFRSSQYKYVLAVGDLDYNGSFSGDVTIYQFDTEGNYNSNLVYQVTNDTNFKLNSTSTVLYSNLGDYPQLIERGANYEVITTILLCICMCSAVVGRIFYYRSRR